MQNICIFYAPVMEISFNRVLTRSGRFLVKLGDVVKESRLCNKNQKGPFTKTKKLFCPYEYFLGGGFSV